MAQYSYASSLRHSPYLDEAINDQQKIVDDARKSLEGVKFDGFIGMGLSGSMVAPLLAFVMGKRFAIVRKIKDGTHSHSATAEGIESGLMNGDRWLFCDDFVSSGSTRKEVVDRIKEHHVVDVEYVGDYLYAAGGYSKSYLDGHDYRTGREL